MVDPVPAEFHLAPTPGTRCTGHLLEGGLPPVRVHLSSRLEPVVAALLTGGAVGSVLGGHSDAGAVARRLVQLDLATPRPPTDSQVRRRGRVVGIIPAHQAAASIEAAIASLAHTDEVIVVDDGSTDDTAAVAEAAGARVLRRHRPGGPAAARNHGAACADAQVLVFLDADAEAEPEWFRPLLAHLVDPVVGAAAPRITTMPGETAVARYERSSGGLDLGTEPGIVRPDGRIPFVSTTALVVRRDAFDQLGGFAEDMRFGEDVDLVWRLAATGRSVVYEPSTVVRHHHRPTAGAQLRNQFRYASAGGSLEARHRVPRAPGGHPLVVAGAFAAVVGGRRTALVLIAGGTTLLTRRLVDVGIPAPDAARLATRTVIRWLRGLAASASRPWFPLTVGVALGRTRSRVPLALSVGGRWLSLAARRDSVERTGTWLVIRALEDAAHSAGTVAGCVRARRIGPLLPAVAPEPTVITSVLGREVHLP